MQRPRLNVGFVPKPEVAASFDDLIGDREQPGLESETKQFGGLQIDDQREFSRLNDR